MPKGSADSCGCEDSCKGHSPLFCVVGDAAISIQVTSGHLWNFSLGSHSPLSTTHPQAESRNIRVQSRQQQTKSHTDPRKELVLSLTKHKFTSLNLHMIMSGLSARDVSEAELQ